MIQRTEAKMILSLFLCFLVGASAAPADNPALNGNESIRPISSNVLFNLIIWPNNPPKISLSNNLILQVPANGTLYDALAIAQKNQKLTFDGKWYDEWGIYITTVNGVAATDNEAWLFYSIGLNQNIYNRPTPDQLLPLGASSYIPKPGERILFWRRDFDFLLNESNAVTRRCPWLLENVWFNLVIWPNNPQLSVGKNLILKGQPNGTLYDALAVAQEQQKLTFDGKWYETLGIYITTVDGIVARDKEAWLFYSLRWDQNIWNTPTPDQLLPLGASSYIPKFGERILFWRRNYDFAHS